MKNSKILSHRGFWLAAASTLALTATIAQAQAQETTTSAPAADSTVVVVTATRRASNIQKVPYNISAVSAKEVERLGITDLSDLSRNVPGLAFRDVGPRNTGSIILRGLSVDPIRRSDGGDNGSVATYINDTPVSNQPKVVDIDHIEVLRGPQGTLYGSGSLGGAVRYIVNDPKPVFEASLGAKIYKIDEASKLSSDVRGVINLPLGDKVAVRLATDSLNDSGFTDYPFIITGPQKDLDYEHRTTTRLSLKATPTDKLTVTASLYNDNSKSGGRTGGNPGYQRDPNSFPAFTYTRDKNHVLGDYEIGQRFPEPYSSHYNLAALELKYDLGWADLSSSTSHINRTRLGHRDQTDLLIGLGFGYENYPDFRAFTTETGEFDSLVEELRLVSKTEGPLSYVAGLYYDQEKSQSTSKEFTPGFTQFIGATRTDDLEYFESPHSKYHEVAAFGELTWHISDAWQVTGGARVFNLKTESEGCTALPLYDDPNSSNISFSCPSGKSDVTKTIYKANTSYQATPDIMYYATFSQGFRRGGANNLPSGGQFTGVDPSQLSYKPDSVDNTEAGVRSQWFDHRLTLNAALFNIDWKDVQLASLAPGNLGITANAGKARSQGLELETRWKATDALTLGLGYAHTKAELTEDYIKRKTNGRTVAYFLKGTKLPGSPDDQINLAADYVVPHFDLGTLTLHGDASYSSDITTAAELYSCRAGTGSQRCDTPALTPSLRNNLDYKVLKGYTQINLAVSLEAKDGIDVRVYINNVANTYAYVAQQGEATYGAQGKFLVPIRPRVIGVEVNKHF